MPLLKQMQKKIRTKRIELLLEKVPIKESWKILDVGGTAPTWRLKGLDRFKVTLLNLQAPAVPNDLANRLDSVAGDATNLKYGDDSYDFVFSNSVIEHVGTYQNQEKFAKEVLRTAKSVWVQTPAKEFFFEPHYITPFIHWLPREHRGKFVRWCTLWGLFTKPTKQAVVERVAEIRLLTKDEMITLFPGCEILEEKMWGMTKSYVALRNPKSSDIGAD